ncbi:chemotaxis protein [Ferrimonas balearica]|uniref:chemotaxis protein n=1 Tax=Ferrimonas balearica TaxID=44012 RepID=UPI001C9A2634|nr:chemotaxis protein [Ferrimonas balearica]MBY5921625.1 chemotaxis protein [Ferrimonas balearica]MBY5995035.1 chemotaxis protein [Ferrimonas balearica]
MRNAWRMLMVGLLVIASSGCSLLEIKLESGIEPLPQEQLNMRVFSRDFSTVFYSGVELAADRMVAMEREAAEREGRPVNILIESHALMWKIGAEQALQRSIFQASPIASMVDTWALTGQMAAFFDGGDGADLFGPYQFVAVAASHALAEEFESTSKGFLSRSDFASHRQFIADYVAANPIVDLSFPRTSAFNDWLAFRGISELEAITTFGTVPEVMSDISDRMAMMTEQTPKILGWKAQLYALHANINADEVQKTLVEISATSRQFQRLMAQSPEMMRTLAEDMNRELMPLVERLDEMSNDKLAQLSVEREALVLMVRAERQALEEMVTRERAAAAADLDHIAQQAVEKAFQQLTTTLKSLILYFVLFVLVIFFAPLGLGVWLGKRMAVKAN